MLRPTSFTIKILLSTFIIIIVGLSVFLPIYFIVLKEEVILPSECDSAYICIHKDDDFQFLNLTGDGSYSNPYIIENLSISGNYFHGIQISGITKQVIIQKSYFNTSVGIDISGVNTGSVRILQNEFHCMYGVISTDSSNSIISDNTFRHFSVGVQLSNSTDAIVSNNIFQDSLLPDWDGTIKGRGLYSYSINSSISDNTFINCYSGIVMRLSEDNSVVSNIFIENRYGFLTNYCVNINVTNNFFQGNTLGLELWENTGEIIVNNSFYIDGIFLKTEPDVFMNNKVNGKAIGFWSDHTNLRINLPLYGQLFFYRCYNLTVENQIVSNTLWGIFIDSCRESKIINNTCSNNSEIGIYLQESDYSLVLNNSCKDNEYGLKIVASESVTIHNNTIFSNNKYGLLLRDHIRFLVASGNNISNNPWGGIYLGGVNSIELIIKYNHFLGNGGYGVRLHGADYCTIHHNNFIDNAVGLPSQAFGSGINDKWYDISLLEGNYWSGWNTSSPYTIAGVYSVDPYPLENEVSI